MGQQRWKRCQWGWHMDASHGGWMAQVYDDNPRIWRIFNSQEGQVAEGHANMDDAFAKRRAREVMQALMRETEAK